MNYLDLIHFHSACMQMHDFFIIDSRATPYRTMDNIFYRSKQVLIILLSNECLMKALVFA